MSTDLSRLEELARKATEGPWEQHPLRTMSVQQPVFSCWIPAEAADAAYIAACDPQTILALIDRLRAAEERVAKAPVVKVRGKVGEFATIVVSHDMLGKRVAIVEVP